MLLALQRRGVELVDLRKFPRAARLVVIGPSEGLFLYFNKRLTPIDHVIVNGIVAVSCQAGKSCRLAHFEETDDSAVAVLEADDPRTLEYVATALFERAWQEGARRKQFAAASMHDEDHLAVLNADLESVLSRRLIHEHLPDFLAALDCARLLRARAGLELNAPLVLNYYGPTYNSNIIDSTVGAVVVGPDGQAHGAVNVGMGPGALTPASASDLAGRDAGHAKVPMAESVEDVGPGGGAGGSPPRGERAE
jgi:hypothetical protein